MLLFYLICDILFATKYEDVIGTLTKPVLLYRIAPRLEGCVSSREETRRADSRGDG